MVGVLVSADGKIDSQTICSARREPAEPPKRKKLKLPSTEIAATITIGMILAALLACATGGACGVG